MRVILIIFNKGLSEDYLKNSSERLGRPDEVANVMVFLASKYAHTLREYYF